VKRERRLFQCIIVCSISEWNVKSEGPQKGRCESCEVETPLIAAPRQSRMDWNVEISTPVSNPKAPSVIGVPRFILSCSPTKDVRSYTRVQDADFRAKQGQVSGKKKGRCVSIFRQAVHCGIELCNTYVIHDTHALYASNCKVMPAGSNPLEMILRWTSMQ